MAARGPGAAKGFLRARVSGRVQGVGFRWSAINEARRLGLGGRVRNAEDGSVEVEASGGAAALAEFLAWLRRGPSGAWVTGVEVDPTGRWPDDFDAEF
jgi:acylphosphatase